MDNVQLLVTGDDSTLLKNVIDVAFKQHGLSTVSGWAEVEKVGLVIYWGEPEGSQPFGPVGASSELLSQQVDAWLKTTQYELYLGMPKDIDGDVSEGWMVYHPDSITAPHDVPEKFHVVCVIKPHYVYYGK